MASAVVLVNGLPGAGKTTLGTGLAGELSAQLLSKDLIKEALASTLIDPVSVGSLGALAMEVVWNLAAALTGTVVIDSWWFRERDLQFAAEGLQRSGASAAVEVWCDVPATLAQTRYAARKRSAVYEDSRHLAEDWQRWAAEAVPLALSPVVRVDTSMPVDCAALVAKLRPHLRGHPRPPAS